MATARVVRMRVERENRRRGECGAEYRHDDMVT